MPTPPAFAETQRLLRHWWPLLLVPLLLGPLLLSVPWAQTGHFPLRPALVVAALELLVLALAPVLDVRLDATGACYRLRPLQWRWRHVPWAGVARAYVRHYDPLDEYGGWGLKGTAANRAYNIAGDEGLQLELPDGRRLLLGTQRPAELRAALAALPARPATA